MLDTPDMAFNDAVREIVNERYILIPWRNEEKRYKKNSTRC